MKVRLAIAITLGLGTAAQAEIIVRSGEHASFSRLVFTTPQGTDWRLVDEGESVRVVLDSPSESFQTKQVFERMPRTRISALDASSDGQLRLDLNCECTVSSFQLNPTVFVVDVTDAPQASTPETSKAPNRPVARPVEDVVLPVLPERTTRLATVVPVITPNTTSEPPQADLSGSAEALAALTTARSRLVTELGRAASQGLLETTTTLDVTQQAPEVQAAIAPAKLEPRSAPTSLPPNAPINLRAESSVDEALAEVLADSFNATSIAECMDSNMLDVASWSDNSGFQQEVGLLHRQLYGEFDKIDPDIATQLAKLYISYGFGAEALFVLHLLNPLQTEHKILSAMAETLEYGTAFDQNAFADQELCDSPAALWAVLSNPAFGSDTEVNKEALLRSFDALPAHLRRYIGPIMSKRLRSAGYTDIAQDAMRIVTRGNRKNDSEAEMELSQLALLQGDEDLAEDGLERVVSQDEGPGPEALIDLIDLRMSLGEPIDADLATLAAAYAFEFRNSELGVALQRAHVLALVDSGQFGAAVDGLAALEGELLPKIVQQTRSTIFDVVTQKAPEAEFLKLTLPFFAHYERSVLPKTENAVANRLLDLGISQPTDALLADGASGIDGRERRMLRARLALLEDRPRNAISNVLGLDGPAAGKIRREAYILLGEYDRAHQISADLGTEDDVLETAFLSRSWDDYAPIFGEGPMPAFAPTPSRTDDNPAPSLEGSMTAVSMSTSSRAAILDMLGRYHIDVADQIAVGN